MQDSDKKIWVERKGHAATIWLHDPATRNAISLSIWEEMLEILPELAQDPAIKLVYLRGAPAGTFISGGNIREMEGLDPEGLKHYHRVSSAAQQALADFPKLLVAAIDGPCYGGGLSLASHADLRLASDRSRFSIPAAKLGLAYPAFGVARIISLVGVAVTREIMLTARVYSAAEALNLGLITRMGGDLDALVEQLNQEVAPLAPLSLAGMKQIINSLAFPPQSPDVAAELTAISENCRQSADHREGLTAFLAKRPAVFRGV